MKRNHWVLFGAIALLAVGAILIVSSANTSQPPAAPTSNVAATQASAPAPNDGHNHSSKRIPAFLIEPTRASLGPTLDPERFTGLTRDAYRAVRQIPVTIAQLPCYCHCDEGHGHKSLYSCFEDEHAAHCDVCVREALLALTLEKQQRLSPAQIREQIVAQYSR